jgi:glycosyltransferase involved in cell wall biosynthesis
VDSQAPELAIALPDAMTAQLKLLLFVGDFAGGGTQHYVLRLLRGLDRNRFQPTVGCFVAGGPLLRETQALSPIVPFPLSGHLFDAKGIAAVLRLARLIRRERFDVVHTLSDRANVFGLLACALARPRGVVASQRAFDPVYDGFTYASPSLVRLSRFLFRHVPTRLTVNNPVIAEHLERVVGIARERIRIIRNGVDTERFAPRVKDLRLAAELGLTGKGATIGIVARLAARKGHVPLLDAVESFTPLDRPTLVIAGEGPLSASLDAEIRRRSLERFVRRVGFVQDPARLYNVLDVFCLPTTFAEGTPTALVEALSSGVPAIVSDLRQIRSVVTHERTALVVDPAKPSDIAAAIRRLLDEPQLRRRLTENGRRLVLEGYSLETMVRESQAAYEEAIAVRVGPARRPAAS